MDQATEVTPQSIVCASSQQVSRDLAGEAVLLQLQSGVYYGLDEIGAFVWSRLQKPVAVSELRDAILSEYDVTPERCESDLLALLNRLLREGLIELKNA